MEEYKCAFSNTLVTSQFGCEKGEQMTRRGGPDVVYASDEAHQPPVVMGIRLWLLPFLAFRTVFDGKQFDIENQHFVRTDGVAGTTGAIGEFRRNIYLPFGAFFH